LTGGCVLPAFAWRAGVPVVVVAAGCVAELVFGAGVLAVFRSHAAKLSDNAASDTSSVVRGIQASVLLDMG
jgi:hypothetical protein